MNGSGRFRNGSRELSGIGSAGNPSIEGSNGNRTDEQRTRSASEPIDGRLERLSALLGVTVLKVERDLPGHHPSRQQWVAANGRWVPADEHAGPPGERRPARQRWHLLVQRQGEPAVWVHWTSTEIKRAVRDVVPDTPRAGRSALALLHQEMEDKS